MPDPAGQELIKKAVDDGLVSAASIKLFSPDIGVQMNNALGVPAMSVKASDMYLLTLLVDDSGSIEAHNNVDNMRNGVNLVLDAVMGAVKAKNVLVHIRYLNGKILCPYCHVEDAPRLDARTYNPRDFGGTPLYDQSVIMLFSVIGKIQEARDNGQSTLTRTLIITDGHDEHSHNTRPSDVAKLVSDLYRSEDNVVSFMGIADGITDYKKVAKSMGIQEDRIMTPANTPKEIRAAFTLYSQTASQISQQAAQPTPQAGGGFSV